MQKVLLGGTLRFLSLFCKKEPGTFPGTEIASKSFAMQLPNPHHLRADRMSASQTTQVVGYRFGRYVLLKKIAQGGMAEIFKAKYLGESGFSKDVCIKRLLPVWSDNPMFINMLVDEAKALVHLSHPNIVQVFELGRDGKTFYISMELVEGIDLSKLLERTALQEKPLSLQFVLYLMAEILKALRFAHSRRDEAGQPLGIIHRDISPQNILLAFEGQVKVTDFGIAKGAHRSLQTTQHQVKGKYSYMSPEQARGESVDHRTDLYAAGILLYELLENQKLFDAVNDLATLEKVRAAQLPSHALQRWPGGLRAVVFKALQKEPAYRYGDAEAFLKDIEKIMHQQKCSSNAEAFSRYLQELFPKTVSAETIVETAPVVKVPKKFWRLALARPALALSWIPLGLIGFWFWPKAKTLLPPTPPAAVEIKTTTVPLLGSITVDAKPEAATGKLNLDGKEQEFVTPFYLGKLDMTKAKAGRLYLKTKEGQAQEAEFILNADQPHWVKTFIFEKPKPGILKVSAKPWGEVTIPGVLDRQETPITGLPLRSGEYRVEVHYPPTNQKTEKVIQLASGTQIFCQAEFDPSPQLVCH